MCQVQKPIRSIVHKKKLSMMRSAVDAYAIQSSVLLYRTRHFCSRTVIDGKNQTLKLYANKTSVTAFGCSVTSDILTVNNTYLPHTQVKIILTTSSTSVNL